MKLKHRIVGLGILAATAAVVAVGVYFEKKRHVPYLRPGLRRPKPSFEETDELDFESEESDELEPADIVYADDTPCRVPPQPWDVVSATFGLEGDDATGCTPPADLEPLAKTEVAFAQGGEEPKWPLATDEDSKLRVSYKDVRGLFHGKWGREFGATRRSTDKKTGEIYRRVHVGVDLFADDGDVVKAMEPGTVFALLPYYKGLGAVYIKNDSGLIVNYGEVKMNSWKEFGLKVGDEVVADQPLARVGVSNDGSHMLHIETFDPATTVEEIRRGELRWIAGEEPPTNVLDPTRYLVAARQGAIESRTT